jgi:hypothetical protein
MANSERDVVIPSIDLDYVQESASESAAEVVVKVYGLALFVFGAGDGSVTVLFPQTGNRGAKHELSATIDKKKFDLEPVGHWLRIGNGVTTAVQSDVNPWKEIERILDISPIVKGRHLDPVLELLTKGVQSAVTISGAIIESAFPVSLVGQATMWHYRGADNLYTDLATVRFRDQKVMVERLDGAGNEAGTVPCPTGLLFANVDTAVVKGKADCSELVETRGYYRLFGLEGEEEIPQAVAGVGTKPVFVTSGPHGCNCNNGRVTFVGWQPS